MEKYEAPLFDLRRNVMMGRGALSKMLRRAGDFVEPPPPPGVFSRLGTGLDNAYNKGLGYLQNPRQSLLRMEQQLPDSLRVRLPPSQSNFILPSGSSMPPDLQKLWLRLKNRVSVPAAPSMTLGTGRNSIDLKRNLLGANVRFQADYPDPM